MIRNLLLLLLFLFSFVSFAQQGSASPYSFFGIGDVRYKGTHEINAMGGLSIVPDSIHINLQNPASYSSLKLTAFTIGGTFTATKYKTNETTEKSQRATLDYLAIAIPLKKFGAAVGLIPYSSLGYKIKDVDNVNNNIRRYNASGGLNKAFVGCGYQINPNVRIGADFTYNFGRVETNNINYQSAAQYGSQEYNASDLSGFNMNFGAMYTTKINKKLDFYSAVTYTPESDLHSNNENKIFTIRYIGDLPPIPVDYLDTQYSNTILKLPSKFSIGAGVGQSKKWLLGTEVTFQGMSSFTPRVSNSSNVKYENTVKYTLGGYYIPNYNSFTSYFKKITYRAGLRYENTGLVINNSAINDYAFTGGLGMPVGGAFSNVNLGFELGRRGTTAANLIEENYANIIISLSLNDKWFTKRKYD